MISPGLWATATAIAASRIGKSIRTRPLRMASHPRTVTSIGQPPAQMLCARTMTRPATNDRMPDKKITPGSGEICSTNSRNEPRVTNTAAAIATSVGPIRPAIIFDVVMANAKRCDVRSVHQANLDRSSAIRTDGCQNCRLRLWLSWRLSVSVSPLEYQLMAQVKSRKYPPIECSDIYFLYRPAVGVDAAHGFEDVRRLYILLKPWRMKIYRLLIVGRNLKRRTRRIRVLVGSKKRNFPRNYRKNSEAGGSFPWIRQIFSITRGAEV